MKLKGWVIRGREEGFAESIYWNGLSAEMGDPEDAAIVRSVEVADCIIYDLHTRYAARFKAIPYRDDL